MTAPTVSVLIVNWNAGPLLAACVDSLAAAARDLRYEAIIVDNASTDGSADLLAPTPAVRLIRSPQNLGFAAGTNLAAEAARGRQLLLLNPDTVCRPRALGALSQYLDDHPDVAAVGPRLLHTDGRIQRSCWRGYPGVQSALIDAVYLWKLDRLPIVRRHEVTMGKGTGPLDVDHLLGACMLIPRPVWQSVGPLDPGYFLFLEETDWCLRARRAGWRIAYLPQAEVVHHGEHSVYQVPIRSVPQYYRSYARFVRAHGAARARMATLKTTFAAAALVRIGLWSTRLFGRRRQLAIGMLRGYSRVLGECARY